MSKQSSSAPAPPATATLLPAAPAGLVTIDPADDPLLVHYANEDEERRQIWSQANEAFRGVVVKIGEWFLNVHRVDILQRYQLAELIKKVHDDHMKNRERRYGTYAIRRLMRFFRWEVTTLRAALRLAEVYTRPEIEALSRQRLRDGRPLSYYHVELLSGILDRKEREKCLARTLAESWNTRELAYHIHDLGRPPGKEAEARGRPLAVPKNLDAVLRQQDRTADDFLNRSLKVWEQPEHGLLAMIRESSPEQCTEERAAQLLAHAQKLRRLAGEALKRAEEAELAHSLVLRGLEGREKGTNSPAPRSAKPDCLGKNKCAALVASVDRAAD